MRVYRVIGTTTTSCFVDVRAGSPEEAEDLAKIDDPRMEIADVRDLREAETGSAPGPIPRAPRTPPQVRPGNRRRRGSWIARRSLRPLVLLAANGHTYEAAALLFLIYVAVHFIRKAW